MIKKNVTKFLAFPKKELMQQSFNKVVGKWSEKHGIYLSRAFKDDLLQFYFKVYFHLKISEVSFNPIQDAAKKAPLPVFLL